MSGADEGLHLLCPLSPPADAPIHVFRDDLWLHDCVLHLRFTSEKARALGRMIEQAEGLGLVEGGELFASPAIRTRPDRFRICDVSEPEPSEVLTRETDPVMAIVRQRLEEGGGCPIFLAPDFPLPPSFSGSAVPSEQRRRLDVGAGGVQFRFREFETGLWFHTPLLSAERVASIARKGALYEAEGGERSGRFAGLVGDDPALAVAVLEEAADVERARAVGDGAGAGRPALEGVGRSDVAGLLSVEAARLRERALAALAHLDLAPGRRAVVRTAGR